MKIELCTKEDVEIIRTFYKDVDIMKMITGEVVSHQEFMKKMDIIFSWDSQRGYGYYKFYDCNQLIGIGCLKPYNNQVEVGYMLYKEFWGQGYGKKLCQLLIEKTRNLHFDKVVAFIDSQNIASKKILTYCGFKSYNKGNKEFLEMKLKNQITGYTGLYGIVANPIKHSFSPMMHNTAFQTLGIDDVYLAFEVEEENLQDYITSVKTLNIKGFNVSMPYKLKIIDYLDEITEEAKLCQAVNTVKNDHGRLIGHISDGKGFFMACEEKNWYIQNQKIVILGAGGAACAILVEAARQGAKEIIVYNRSAKPFIEELDNQLDCPIILKRLNDLESLKNDLSNAYLLIQTTNVGMKPDIEGCLIPDGSYLPAQLKVADIIYNPQETKLLSLAKERGCEYMNGEGMILYQGAVSFEYWTNQKMPIQEVKQALGMG